MKQLIKSKKHDKSTISVSINSANNIDLDENGKSIHNEDSADLSHGIVDLKYWVRDNLDQVNSVIFNAYYYIIKTEKL